jgi:hypothetical protein
MKRRLLSLVPCVLLGAAVFFTVNHAARARLIVAAAGELPNIPGCPLHESCVRALREGQPVFPAAAFGGLAGAGAVVLTAAALPLIRRRRRDVPALITFLAP